MVRGLALGAAALALSACTGTNLDAGLSGAGLAPATTVAAATPEDAVLPPAAVPDGGDVVAAAAASAGATDTATQEGESVPDAVAAVAAIAAPSSLAASAATAAAPAVLAVAPLPPGSVPSTAPRASRERSFRPLALAPTETRREKRAREKRAKRNEAFRARAERASLVAPRKTRAKTRAEKRAERRTRIVVPRKAARASGALPGVRKRSSIFEIGRPKTNDAARSFRVASAAGLARLSGNGLRKQTAHVQTECFKPGLVAALQRAERHFGKPVIVTSGYRSPKGNRRAGGAKGSKHVSCEAADVQIEGVSKWTLAKYFRSLPDRGGVGTYCHTKSVHYDIGSQRDWNWACRKKRR